jgi:molecular chaperone GrpE
LEDEEQHRIEIEDEDSGEELREDEEETPGDEETDTEKKVPEWEISEEELADMESLDLKKEEEAEEGPSYEEQVKELDDKYVRLYAEFENYRKRVLKEKEDLASYVREELIYELLTSLDHLDIALKHANEDETYRGIRQGVEMTLREINRTLEKFGLKPIEALGKPFDPEFHHAVSRVESDEADENTVIEELRKGYMYGDKVLRAAMVAVSRRPGEAEAGEEEEETAESDDSDDNDMDTKEEE